MVTNTSASFKSSSRLSRIDLRYVVWFSLLVLVGSMATLNPAFSLISLAVVAALGLLWLAVVQVKRAKLEFWQVLVLIALTGYLLLNYGFENLAFHAGRIPIILSYGVMYGAFALAVLGHQHSIARVLKEPAMLCVLALLVLMLLHLVEDVPSYGIWAFRDSTMCLDGIFLMLGLLWARKPNSALFLIKWLLVVFVLNLVYSFTLPWGEQLWSWSPQSGVFLSVPLLGNYNGTGDRLLSGALLCICLGNSVIKRPRWMMLLLAMAQFLGVAISQVRRMYIATVVALIVFMLLGEIKKFVKLFILLPVAITVILLATTLGGLEITGRIGEVNLDFFKEHIRSITTSEGTPGSARETRFDWAGEAFQRFRAHPVVGEGFGLPLLTDIDETNGSVTRMPHNSSLSFLARLGVIGFALWIAFHFCLIKRFISGLRQRRFCGDQRLSGLVLWLFMYYLLIIIDSLVETPFEFPSAAIPFYFLMGFALGLIRWQLSDKNNGNTRLTEFAGSVEKA